MCHATALDTQGNVYTWGIGTYGILGDGQNTNAKLPVHNEALASYSEEHPDNKIVDISAAD